MWETSTDQSRLNNGEEGQSKSSNGGWEEEWVKVVQRYKEKTEQQWIVSGNIESKQIALKASKR